MPIAPRRTTFANPSGTPRITAVPQSGPITRSCLRSASVFSARSCSSGTLSLKRKTCRPRRNAFSASAPAYGPGTEICASAAGAPVARPSAIERGGAASTRPMDGAVRSPASRPAIASSAAATATGDCASTTIIRSFARAGASSSRSSPASSSIALFAGVPSSSVARSTPGSASASWPTRISVTESL